MLAMSRGALLPLLVFLARNADGIHIKDKSLQHDVGEPRPTLIKAYYINKKSSTERKRCMESQLKLLQDNLAKINTDFTFLRWPAVEINHCNDTSSCMRLHPKCFPTGKAGKLARTDAVDEGAGIRGVVGNWCAHLNLLRGLGKVHETYQSPVDYYFILEDDLIIDVQNLVESLDKLFKTSKRTWPLIAFDTFGSQAKDDAKQVQHRIKHSEMSYAPIEDLAAGGLQLYSISHAWGYWGAHAWLVDALHLKRFVEFYSDLHTLPVDWIPKVVRPLHLGMMAYQTGSITQRNLLGEATLSESCSVESDSDILSAANLYDSGISEEDLGLDGLVLELKSDIDEVVILGMHNSGTNLLYNLFHNYIEKPNDIELCKDYYRKAYCGNIWKHTNPNRFNQLRKSRRKNFDRTLAIVLVRHPLSQLKLWQTSPHHLACGGTHLTEPCLCDNATDTNLMSAIMPEVPRPMCDTDSPETPCWNSLVDGWNSHVAGYHKLDSLFGKVMVVRYEDLVESPIDVLRQISTNLGMQSPAMSNTSSFLQAKSRQFALDALRSPNYMSDFPRDELKRFCAALDKTSLFRLGYHGCQDFHDSVFNHVFYEFE